ncbi:MAG: TetR/AcrR family transcriptional regulator [Desulfatitalea sp.]|nr:TetR/AcrR family transcriptional regulator [Desulfatitalea sp.]
MPKETLFKIAADKRERLLRQAALLFAERGLNQTDMAALAGRVGIAKGSLYNYFDSKEELYLYVCRDGLERSRQAVYGTLDPDWDTYRQVDHIFCQGARFVQSHPEYLILYTNIASAGMARFAEQISQEVEHYTADHLKRVLRRDMAAGIVRDDLDVTLVAFTINSLYIVFMTSLVSGHFRIRMREYLEITGELDPPAIEALIVRTTTMIHRMLQPISAPANE